MNDPTVLVDIHKDRQVSLRMIFSEYELERLASRLAPRGFNPLIFLGLVIGNLDLNPFNLRRLQTVIERDDGQIISGNMAQWIVTITLVSPVSMGNSDVEWLRRVGQDAIMRALHST